MADKAILKAHLLAQTEAAIDELRAGRKGENTLSEIENLVEATGQALTPIPRRWLSHWLWHCWKWR